MNKRAITLDKIGMCTSIICMAHCLSIPIFLLFGFDSLLRFIDQEWIEWTFIVFALFVGIGSFIPGFLTHRQHFVPVLFVSGFLLLVNGESIGNGWISVGLSIAGAFVIGYAHIQNLLLKQRVHAK